MSAKDKKKVSKIALIIAIFTLLVIMIHIKYITNKESYAVNNNKNETFSDEIHISNAKEMNLEYIIKKNTEKSNKKEEIYEKEEELEYITKYRNNSELYVGTRKVSQEGRNGIQTITIKKTFDNDGKTVNEEQVGCVVTKASINKIIDIGIKIYIEQKKEEETNSSNNLTQDIQLNKPSGFSAEQFKIALTDSKDVNKIFQNNSEYFYYIEDQYNINGLFVASIGIHESAWGTSKLAKNKYNLFGYGAYDSNPYNGAYTFTSYSESIDLVARVLVKYYLNPSGTTIYDNQQASGKYYNGSTIWGVNKKYATDKNWGNAVYKYMQYLYSKI